ncbi:hypothetical protein [Sphingomonas sp. RS2018]
MDFEGAIKSVGSQLAVVVAAPVPFVISLAILAVAIWQICHWYFDGRISSLEARLSFKTDEVAALKDKLAKPDTPETKPSGSILNDMVKSAADKRITERKLALNKMAKALHDAEIEKTFAKGRFSDRNVPALRAAILTAEKLFGIVPPYPLPENHGGPLTLWAGINLFRQVLPLLEDGHDEEARRTSQKLYDDEKARFEKPTETS